PLSRQEPGGALAGCERYQARTERSRRVNRSGAQACVGERRVEVGGCGPRGVHRGGRVDDRRRTPAVACDDVDTPAPLWHGSHPPDMPPQLMAHLFHFAPGPNRYGPLSFYELHVWAWKDNPRGIFTDWNPNVSCAAWEG